MTVRSDGKNCDLANLCWRFLAPSDEWQSFMDPKERGAKCAYFWPTRKPSPSEERALFKELTEGDK